MTVPERIWAWGFSDIDRDNYPTFEWIWDDDSPLVHSEWLAAVEMPPTEYISTDPQALAASPEVQALVEAAVKAERVKWEACLAVAMGGCDANEGLEHSPISLPHDKGYTFCQRCGETLTKRSAKAASSAAVQRAAAIRKGDTP